MEIDKGQKVKHDCENPRCNLEGKVIDTTKKPSNTLAGMPEIEWVYVKWDLTQTQDNRDSITQWIARNKIKTIGDKKDA